MFMIVRIEGKETKETYVEDDGKPAVYATGDAAAQMAAVLRGSRGGKWQPRPFAGDENWRERERLRFESGVYQPLPWAGQWWFTDRAVQELASQEGRYGDMDRLSGAGIVDHFAHVSTDQSGMIAYTESAEKGAMDRQTRIKPGRYLERYFSGFFGDPNILRRFACEFSVRYGTCKIAFATTAEEIERVYLNGPSSCMANGVSSYEVKIHPTRVYAAGDLAVAYLTNDDGDISARALCWPAKKIYSRVYGDSDRFGDLIRAEGYIQNQSGFAGARLQRVEYRSGFVVPYVDGFSRGLDDGEYIIIGMGGDVCLESTCGWSSRYGDDEDEDEEAYDYNCDRCEEGCNENYRVYVSPGRNGRRYWCESCFDDHAFACEATGDLWQNDYRIELADGTVWSEHYFENHGGTCAATGEHYRYGDLVCLADGTCWSREHFEVHGFTDPDNGELYSMADGFADPVTGETVCEATLDARREARAVGDLFELAASDDGMSERVAA